MVLTAAFVDRYARKKGDTESQIKSTSYGTLRSSFDAEHILNFGGHPPFLF